MLTPKTVLTPMIALVTALLAVPGLAHAAGHPLKVVTTVAPLTNIVANVSRRVMPM